MEDDAHEGVPPRDPWLGSYVWGMPLLGWFIPALFAVLIVLKVGETLRSRVRRGLFRWRFRAATAETADRAAAVADEREIARFVTRARCTCGRRYEMLAMQSRESVRMGDRQLQVLRMACTACARARPFYFERR